MSVQTGICHFDGRHTPSRDVSLLLDGLENRGSDYVNTFVSGCLGMGFRGVLVTPEDRQNQPVVGMSGAAITFDGRLDCREDVCARVSCQYEPVDDATLVLLAYEKEGSDCFDSLMGEFAFVLWDCAQQSLFFVRSLCGSRPLYYVADDRRVLWSSELDDLVLKSGIDPVVNDAYAIGFIYYQPDIDESPFRNVAVVPPGSYIRVKSSGEVSPPVATWHPERVSALCLASDSLYEEAWRQEVETAIADRLRAKHPVFSELSGGLDSSTLVFMADKVLKGAGKSPETLTTVSCTFETSKSADESFFVSVLEKARGRTGIHICEEALDVKTGLDEIEFTGLPNTQHLFPGRYRAIEALMKAAGARVLLTGNGGDEIFWSDPAGSPELADLLIQGRIGSALSLGFRWSQSSETEFWRLFLAQAIAPIATGVPLIQGLLSNGLLTSWATPKARHWLTLPGRRFGLRVDTRAKLPSRRTLLLSIRSSCALLAAGYYHEYLGIYFSHPFSHQRLMNFTLSLPMSQLTRPGESRSLMRRAMRGVLPEKTRSRESKGTLEEPVCRMLAKSRNAFDNLENFEVCRRGYAEPTRLARAVRESSLGKVQQASGLLRLFSLERWLRSLRQIGARRSDLKRRTMEPQEELYGLSGTPIHVSGASRL